jgi:hypothetical protein
MTNDENRKCGRGLLLNENTLVAGKSGAEAAALQTLREAWWRKEKVRRRKCEWLMTK